MPTDARPAARAAPPRRAVVVTAIPIEYAAVRAHLRDIREVVHPAGTVYEVGTFDGSTGTWSVGLVEAGAGNEAAALEAERAIAHFAASHALFVGVAGGLKDVALGDVVAATRVYGYESGKDAGDFRPRPDVGESSYDFVSRARAVARRWSTEAPPRAFVGPIAAGAKVVASAASVTAALLRETYGDALAVEMEGRGFLRASHATPGLSALVIRGISDLLDGKAAADAAGSQDTAARHAARFAFDVLGALGTGLGADGLHPTQTGDRYTREAGAAPDELTIESFASAPPTARQILDVLTPLYPSGPMDRHLWERAGGDVTRLELRGAGRDAWFGALRLVERGGGGATFTSLLWEAQTDYPRNRELEALIKSLAPFVE